jgi:hypothetical protein
MLAYVYHSPGVSASKEFKSSSDHGEEGISKAIRKLKTRVRSDSEGSQTPDGRWTTEPWSKPKGIRPKGWCHFCAKLPYERGSIEGIQVRMWHELPCIPKWDERTRTWLAPNPSRMLWHHWGYSLHGIPKISLMDLQHISRHPTFDGRCLHTLRVEQSTL